MAPVSRLAAIVCAVAGSFGCTPTEPPAPVVSAVEVSPPPAAPSRQISLIAAGDIQLDRGVERGFSTADMYVMFEGVRAQLRAADIAVANLESLIARGGRRKRGGIAFRAHPNTVLSLVDSGFDALSIANNHADDYGPQALLETSRRLREAGIVSLGVSEIEEARPVHRILVRNGTRVALLGFTVFTMGHAQVPPNVEGVREQMADDIRRARADADTVVVSFHWGDEYQREPNIWQQTLGRTAVDAGADLVVGHHPHVYQGVEVYRGRAIVHSLGNFLFDQPWAHTRNGLMADWIWREDGDHRLRIWAVHIKPEPYRVRTLFGEDARPVLEHVAELSSALGATAILDGSVLDIQLRPPSRLVAERLTDDSHMFAAAEP